MSALLHCHLPTFFAPAERLDAAEVSRQVAAIGERSNLKRLLDTIPSLVMILNRERQILLCNRTAEELAERLGHASVEGMRPGEFLSCQHAVSAEHGCGTSEACRTCGAVQAIMQANAGRKSTQECRVAATTGTAFDLRVTANPFAWHGADYTLMVVDDISNEKRRHLLERVFFHDVLNTAGSVAGIAALIADDPALTADLKDDLVHSADMLVNEIKSQRLILAAENGSLQTESGPVALQDALRGVQQLYRNHPVAADRRIELSLPAGPVEIVTDPTLLHRVLANLVKNALEAIRPGETVTLGADMEPEGCSCWCSNPGVIPPNVALQIFNRSFSTKGHGRGIGTYSIKLLVERYLHGRVSFTSTSPGGTRFVVNLPRSI